MTADQRTARQARNPARPATIGVVGFEPVLAALATLIGIALTSVGVFTHTGSVGSQLVAPGALLALVGGGWLGVALARRDVRLLPGSQIVATERSDTEEATA